MEGSYNDNLGLEKVVCSVTIVPIIRRKVIVFSKLAQKIVRSCKNCKSMKVIENASYIIPLMRLILDLQELFLILIFYVQKNVLNFLYKENVKNSYKKMFLPTSRELTHMQDIRFMVYTIHLDLISLIREVDRLNWIVREIQGIKFIYLL